MGSLRPEAGRKLRLVNIIECRSGTYQSLLHQFAAMSETTIILRDGVLRGRWNSLSSSTPRTVEMRQVENITPYSLWNDIPTVVIVVYDPTDRRSMERVAALLRMEHSAWLPRTSRLALASSDSTWAAALPVWRLKRRAKKHMGQVYVSDLRNRESTRTLFDWTLEEATTRPVPDLDPAEHETSFIEIDDPLYWSKLCYQPPGTKMLRKVVSMFTLRSSKSSHGSGKDETPSTFPSP